MKTVGEITDVLVYDWRFPTSLKSDGSDAVHKDPDYSCVYVKLLTNSKDTTGFGLTFTLARRRPQRPPAQLPSRAPRAAAPPRHRARPRAARDPLPRTTCSRPVA